jgi:hypothetical protein
MGRGTEDRRGDYRLRPGVGGPLPDVVRRDPELKEHQTKFGPTHPDNHGLRPSTGGKK